MPEQLMCNLTTRAHDSFEIAKKDMEASFNLWRRPELAFLIVLVSSIYFCRMATLPEVGEETRWACAAREMLASGDWIVVRQQGEVFPERPTLGIWAMAADGEIRGEVDAVAVRLPSAIATVLMTLVVYIYASHFLPRLGAFASGLTFGTLGQVLQIGRQGESEAVFTLFLGSALLIWHLGYARHWPKWWTCWSGYILAALAALTKGPQAPLYFIAATTLFLLIKRDFRWLVSWQNLTGAAVFLLLVALWQAPYLAMTDMPTVLALWTGLASDRIGTEGIAAHMLNFPLEVLRCLLPWSVFFLVLASRRFCRSLLNERNRDSITFLVVVVAVTFPTLWIAVGAKGRYLMPVYPCIAVLIGLIIDRCATAMPRTWERNSWVRFLVGMSVVVLSSGLLISICSLFPNMINSLELHQGAAYSVFFGMIAVATATILLMTTRLSSTWNYVSLGAAGLFIGLSYTGTIVNEYRAVYNPLDETVQQIREQIPEGTELVSFGPAYHRFVYFYESPIRQVSWPCSSHDVPDEVTYFCFDSYADEEATMRPAGRGRSWTLVPAQLPLRWEKVGVVPCGRLRDEGDSQRTVVIGRIIRDELERSTDASNRDRRLNR